MHEVLEQNAKNTQELRDNGLNWSVEEWKEHYKKADKLALRFWELNPSAKEVGYFEKQIKSYSEAFDSIYNYASDAMRTARIQLDYDEDFVKVRKAVKETARKVRNELKQKSPEDYNNRENL